MNNGSDSSNKLSETGYMLKSLIKITSNPSPEYNLGVFLDSIIRYVKLHHAMFGKYDGELMLKPNKAVLERTSGTFTTFLEKENLEPLIPLFLLTYTSMGYGYLDEVGSLYGLIWHTPNLVISAAFKVLGVEVDPYRTYIFKQGFEHVWNTIVKEEKFDIRFNTKIKKIYRNKWEVKVNYENAASKLQTKKCGFLIWTPPLPGIIKHLSNPSKEERDLFTKLTPLTFVSSLMRAKGTIRNTPKTFYRESLEDKIDDSVTGDLDVEGTLNYCNNQCEKNITDYDEMVSSSRIISIYQLKRNNRNKDQSIEAAKNHFELGFNASNVEIFSTIQWENSFKWSPSEVAKGNHWKVFNMQGKHRTWYAGASVSFESVKSVIEYNKLLLRQFGKYYVDQVCTLDYYYRY